jgi:hypothetical protein
MNITYAYSAVPILTDFTFALLPIHIVMGLQVDTKTKLVLVPIFAMDTIASVACAIRIAYLPKFLEGDFLFKSVGMSFGISLLMPCYTGNTSDIVIWSETERGLAITAGNLATLRPLFRLTIDKIHSWTGKLRSTSEGSGNEGVPKSSNKRNLTLHSSRRNLYRKRSFSRDIEVHTDVDVHREKAITASFIAAPSIPTSSKNNKHRNQAAWLDSTVASKEDQKMTTSSTPKRNRTPFTTPSKRLLSRRALFCGILRDRSGWVMT